MQALGHVVLKVQSLQRSEAFYSGLLGLPIAARISEPVHMSFFTLGNHHDFVSSKSAIEHRGPTARPPASLTWRSRWVIRSTNSTPPSQSSQADIDIAYEMDHTVTKSLYLHDPDGNEIELYVDVSDVEKASPKPSLPPNS